MPATFFLVRAVVAAPPRERFEQWYATDHLPWAMKAFQCEKAWRFWSEVEEMPLLEEILRGGRSANGG